MDNKKPISYKSRTLIEQDWERHWEAGNDTFHLKNNLLNEQDWERHWEAGNDTTLPNEEPHWETRNNSILSNGECTMIKLLIIKSTILSLIVRQHKLYITRV